MPAVEATPGVRRSGTFSQRVFSAYVVEQLAGLGRVRTKRMFGGVGPLLRRVVLRPDRRQCAVFQGGRRQSRRLRRARHEAVPPFRGQAGILDELLSKCRPRRSRMPRIWSLGTQAVRVAAGRAWPSRHDGKSRRSGRDPETSLGSADVGLIAPRCCFRNADVFAPRPARCPRPAARRRQSPLDGPGPRRAAGRARGVDPSVIDLEGRRLIPGLIDGHVHVTGGGGEAGFSTRVPPVPLTRFTTAGVTTVVGLLGTDDVARGPRELLATLHRAARGGPERVGLHGRLPRATDHADRQRPRPTSCSSRRCSAIGEVAISDHRSSQPTFDEIAAARGRRARRGPDDRQGRHPAPAPRRRPARPRRWCGARSTRASCPPRVFNPDARESPPRAVRRSGRAGAGRVHGRHHGVSGRGGRGRLQRRRGAAALSRERRAAGARHRSARTPAAACRVSTPTAASAAWMSVRPGALLADDARAAGGRPAARDACCRRSRRTRPGCCACRTKGRSRPAPMPTSSRWTRQVARIPSSFAARSTSRTAWPSGAAPSSPETTRSRHWMPSKFLTAKRAAGSFRSAARRTRKTTATSSSASCSVSGGSDADIVVIPTASRLHETGPRYERLFRDIGAARVTVMDFDTRRDCQEPGRLQRLEEATGIFFTGGNQLRLTTLLGGTPVAKLIRTRNAQRRHRRRHQRRRQHPERAHDRVRRRGLVGDLGQRAARAGPRAHQPLHHRPAFPRSATASAACSPRSPTTRSRSASASTRTRPPSSARTRPSRSRAAAASRSSTRRK